jgi:hypothetical protein
MRSCLGAQERKIVQQRACGNNFPRKPTSAVLVSLEHTRLAFGRDNLDRSAATRSRGAMKTQCACQIAGPHKKQVVNL